MKHYFLSLVLVMCSCIELHAFKVDGVYYNVLSSKAPYTAEVALQHNTAEGDVVIPVEVTYDGITYTVTNIVGYAFKDCPRLTSVAIGDSVKAIGDGAFYGCSGLLSVKIGENVAEINKETFYGCSALKSIIIPNSAATVGGSAFYQCTSLESASIGNSVTTIKSNAFFGCKNLKSVELGNSVSMIEGSAFNRCESLTSISIPASVKTLGGSVFGNCTSLTSVTINSDAIVNSNQYDSYYNIKNIFGAQVTEYVIGNSVTAIGNYAFSNCSNMTSLKLGNSITSIGSSAFSNCSGLTSIDIPNSVKTINGGAFSGCSSVASVEIGESVETIGNNAFNNCTGLNSVTINSNAIAKLASIHVILSDYASEYIFGNSVTEIGSAALYYCNKLKLLTIGESVKTLGDYAFGMATSLENVTCYAKTPPAGAYNCFYLVPFSSIILYVPAGTVDSYKMAGAWSAFQNFVELESDVLLGDANGDGFVNVNDITTTAQFILEGHADPWNETNADSNCDGAINVNDITATAAIILSGGEEPEKPLDDHEALETLQSMYDKFQTLVCGWNGTSTYNALHFAYNLCADDILSAGSEPFDNDFAGSLNEFRYDNTNPVITYAYNNFVSAMEVPNAIIHKYADRKSITKAQKRCVAEARVLRAYIEMMLAIGWGNPPLYDNVLSELGQLNNCDHNQLLLWCAEECEKAVADLHERASIYDKEGVNYITKGFALAVAGKARLFANDYAGAENDLAQVVASGKYSLVATEDYWKNFHIEGDGNEEKIFEGYVVNLPGDSWGTGLIFRTTWMETNLWNWRRDKFVKDPVANYSSIDGWGGGGVRKDFADEFIANDGENSARLQASLISIEDLIEANPARVHMDSWGYNWPEIDNMTREQKLASDKVGLTQAGLYGQSFYLHLKFIPRKTDLRAPGDNLLMKDFTIMRYAEVLLMYAEALIQNGKPDEALKYINFIQKRAGSQTISTVANMDVLKKEKKLELWLEGCRWADMVRWGDFDGVKENGRHIPWLYDKMSKAPASGDVVWMHGSEANSRFYIEDSHAALDRGDAVGYQNMSATKGLFPYPQDLLNNNPALTQTPGWN